MSKQEIKLLTKIIRELSLYMLMHGYRKFSLTTEYGQSETRFLLKVQGLEESLKNHIKEKVNREREIEVETYGWELVGDVDSHSELEILGLLVDYVEMSEDGEDTVLTFVRKSMYKEKK